MLGASQPNYVPKRHFFSRAGSFGARITQQPRAELHRAGMWGGYHGVTGLSLCGVVWQSSVPVSQCLQTNPQMRKHLVSAAGAGVRCEADGQVLMAEAREQSSPVPGWHCVSGRIGAGHWGWTVCPMGWQCPAALQGSPQSLGQVLRGLWVGKAQSHWRASPGLSRIPKVWFADHAGSSPLSRLCPGHATLPQV